MTWFISESYDLQNIITFLLKDEWKHIQALSHFHKDRIYFSPGKNSVLTLAKKVNDNIESLIVITSRGLIYPVFNKESLSNIYEKIELIKLISSIKFKIHGVIGLKSDVDYFDSILFNRIRGINNYLILHRCSNGNFIINNDFNIKKATLHDLNSLVPLEYEYQKEEVLLSPGDFNIRATKDNFRIKLKNDDIYYIKGRNIPISKAGTTYKSINFTLIGGVFTWKKERNRGYGTELLKYLLNDQLSKGYNGTLFVKDNNDSALHLYKKLGFTEPLPYKINYYYN